MPEKIVFNLQCRTLLTMKKSKPIKSSKSLKPVNPSSFSKSDSMNVFPNKLVKQGKKGLLLHALLYFVIFILFFSLAAILVPELDLTLDISMLTAFFLSLVVTWYIYSMNEDEKKPKPQLAPKIPAEKKRNAKK